MVIRKSQFVIVLENQVNGTELMLHTYGLILCGELREVSRVKQAGLKSKRVAALLPCLQEPKIAGPKLTELTKEPLVTHPPPVLVGR